MLARIAHELFWLGRNLARAEHTARMLDGVFQASLQGRPDDPAGVTLDWSSLLAIMGAPPGEAPARRDDVLRALTLARDNPTSVVACVGRAREGARTVRDVISAEMWEAVNTTNMQLVDGDLSARLRSGPYSVYGYVKERCALFWGLTSRTMLRDEASAFLAAGGRIESADMVLRMLRVALPPGVPEPTSTVEQGQALALLQAVGRLSGLSPRGARAAQRAAGRALPGLRAHLPRLGRRLGRRRPQRARPRRRQPAQLRARPAPAAPERRPRVPRARGGLRRRRARHLRVGPGGAGPGRPRHRRSLFRRGGRHHGARV